MSTWDNVSLMRDQAIKADPWRGGTKGVILEEITALKLLVGSRKRSPSYHKGSRLAATTYRNPSFLGDLSFFLWSSLLCGLSTSSLSGYMQLLSLSL